MTGLYIHVPFCEKRCFYCSFYSTTQGKTERLRFVKSLRAEMQQRSCDDPIPTLYFGGGTPSQLDAEELEAVFSAVHQNFQLTDDAEITFETNPDDVDREKLEQLVRLGVNRLSLGIQSFDDDMLRAINRRHDAQQARDAIRLAHEAGIQNISIDLIYGFPTQTLAHWEKDLTIAFEQDIQHVSAYSLMYEEGTVLYQLREQGKVKEVDEETSLRMFERLITTAHEANFEQYEISNFAKPGFRSRHNSSYWAGTPYIGLGPSAHSYDGNYTRRYNEHSQHRYALATQNIADSTNRQPFDLPRTWDVPHVVEQINDNERYNELILTRLRTKEGLKLRELTESQRHYVEKIAIPFQDCGWLKISNHDGEQYMSFTPEGIFRSDHVMAELMWDD